MLTSYLKRIFNTNISNAINNHQDHGMQYNASGRKSLTIIDNYYDSLQQYSPKNATIYGKNVIVYRCVNLIAQSIGHVPWVVMHANQIIENNHPIYQLLQKPNNEKAGAAFFSEVIASKLLFGNAYILSNATNTETPSELYLLPSNDVSILMHNNLLVGYRYQSPQGSKTYYVDQINKTCEILHIKNYNPNNPYQGLSCLAAASMPIDLHQQATIWNNALLKNGARPSGALIMKDNHAYLNDEQFTRLQEQINEKFSGASNSGRPLLLEGGLDWREMSMNPKDMDFMESKNSAAREIALAFGVPPQLLGINGDNTYSNMQEARLALWEETLIPLLDKLCDSLGCWLSHQYQEDITIDFDRDGISALAEKRQNIWAKIASADFMTINEKRALVGLKPLDDGDICPAISSKI